MKKSNIIIVIVFIVSVSLASAIYALVSGSLWLRNRASQTLLDQLSAVRPNASISSVIDQIGEPMLIAGDVNEILRHSSIQDSTFLTGKKLYWF